MRVAILILALVVFVILVAAGVFFSQNPFMFVTSTPTPLPSATVTLTPTIGNTNTDNIIPSSPNQTNGTTYYVTMSNFTFTPAQITIKAGDTIIWTNQDATQHSVVGPGFSSPVLSNGETYSVTFNDKGTFAYHCGIHPNILGTVIVQ